MAKALFVGGRLDTMMRANRGSYLNSVNKAVQICYSTFVMSLLESHQHVPTRLGTRDSRNANTKTTLSPRHPFMAL